MRSIIRFTPALLFILIILAGQSGCVTLGSRTDCNKLAAWLDVVRDWGQGTDLMRVQSQHFRQMVAPAFHDDVFSPIWGKPYAAMSQGEKASVFRSLNKCSTEGWARVFLSTPFSNPPALVRNTPRSDFAQWQKTISAVNAKTYASLKAQRQQRIAYAKKVKKARAQAAIAAKVRKEQLKKLQVERKRRQQQETEKRVAMVNQYQAHGPFRGDAGAAYLNALYANDRAALAGYDREFNITLREIMADYNKSGMNAITQLMAGKSTAAHVAHGLKTVSANMSLNMFIAGVYIVNYEHVYPKCMDTKPLVYKQTKEYEWVTRDGFGTELYRTPGGTQVRYFRINHRFEDVWHTMSDFQYGGLMLIDTFLGRPGAIRMGSVMSATRSAMQKYKCNSPEMKTLEKNMLAYFRQVSGNIKREIQARPRAR